MGVVAAALLFVAYSIYADIDATGTRVTNYLPFLLLFVALLIALGFEFVNGFHDTANAVATVIYTRSLPANIAVVWSGMFNLFGVLLSIGAVAFGIVSLLPVELILQVGSSAGFAMVFALLIAAIIWNVGTWYFGLPASSSHTLIGSIIGVGITNALMRGRDGTSGVDWSQATYRQGAAAVAAVRLRARGDPAAGAEVRHPQHGALRRAEGRPAAAVVDPRHPDPDLHAGELLPRLQRRPEGHGPDHADPDRHGADRLCAQPRDAGEPDRAVRRRIRRPRARSSSARPPATTCSAIRGPAVTNYVAQHQINEGTYPSLAVLVSDISNQVTKYGSLAKIPADAVGNTRNDMYLASEAIRFLMKDKESDLSDAGGRDAQQLQEVARQRDQVHPAWVKIAVAIALGLGTMIGWKRIVVTVGEKIGKTHLTYAQGACAEITAAATIAAADGYGLPVSTTHVLSSGIAGTMAANGSGLQWSTIRNIALAWVLTLPAAMMLSGSLYWIFSQIF